MGHLDQVVNVVKVDQQEQLVALEHLDQLDHKDLRDHKVDLEIRLANLVSLCCNYLTLHKHQLFYYNEKVFVLNEI